MTKIANHVLAVLLFLFNVELIAQTSDTQTNNVIKVKFIQAESLYESKAYDEALKKLVQIQLDHNISLRRLPRALNLQIKIYIAQRRYIDAAQQLEILLSKKNLSAAILQDIAVYSEGLELLADEERERRVVTSNAINTIAANMITINGGSFLMGSPESEVKRQPDEAQHMINVDAFMISRYEVTRAQFAAFVNDTSYITDAERRGGCYFWDKKWRQRTGVSWKTPTFSQAADEPVTCITWNDANKFAVWVNNIAEDGYRLPTEAQWEYAARAGSQTAFNAGQCISTHRANYKGGAFANCLDVDGFLRRTTEVGRYRPNAWGLYDMHGNVAEWTCSVYSREYNGEESSCTELRDAKRVLRGGSWRHKPAELRSAKRMSGDTSSAARGYFHHGFRLVKNPPLNPNPVQIEPEPNP